MTRPRSLRPLLSLVAVATALLLLVVGATAQAPKYGGVLVTSPLSATPSLSVHEESTVATTQQASPCFNNLVYFDPAKKQESVDTIIPELAEKWSWQDNHRNLVFFLRKDVKWHDGKPFTSQDVKYTFDAVRGAPDAKARLKVNPRKLWYENIEAIEVAGRLHRGLPAQAAAAVAPAHARLGLLARPPRPRAARRVQEQCIGTGPFKLKENKPGELDRVREEPRLLHQGPAVSRRHQVRDHPRPLDADRRAAVRPARRGGQRLEQDERGERQERRAEARRARGRQQRQRQRAGELQARAVLRRARAPRHQPGARPQGLPGRPAPGRRHVRRGAPAQAGRRLGPAGRGGRQAARHGRSRQAERPRPRSCWPRPASAPPIR